MFSNILNYIANKLIMNIIERLKSKNEFIKHLKKRREIE